VAMRNLAVDFRRYQIRQNLLEQAERGRNLGARHFDLAKYMVGKPIHKLTGLDFPAHLLGVKVLLTRGHLALATLALLRHLASLPVCPNARGPGGEDEPPEHVERVKRGWPVRGTPSMGRKSSPFRKSAQRNYAACRFAPAITPQARFTQ